jgi:hypothetical protein
MASKKRAREAEPEPELNAEAASLKCLAECPVCRGEMCEEEGEYAVEITCGCLMADGGPIMWHRECFRRYANEKINQLGPDRQKKNGNIICPGARHPLRVHYDDPLRGLLPIKLDPIAKVAMSDKKHGGPLVELRMKAAAEKENAVKEARAKGREAQLSVQGMKNFLAEFYGTLLPEVLRKFPVDMYSLWWYPPFPGEEVGLGYYGDSEIEPWRTLSPPNEVPYIVPYTVPSTQVQLRVKFKKGKPLNWVEFRDALRLNLGCQCSMAWKYKAATVHMSNGVINYRACEKQIHGVGTWVLALELADTINMCKTSGARKEQIGQIIEQISKPQSGQWPRRQREEISLGETTGEDGVTSYVVYDDCGEVDYWWGCEAQWDDFQRVKKNVENLGKDDALMDLAPVFMDFINCKPEYIAVANFAANSVASYLYPRIETYLSSTPFQEIGEIVVSVGGEVVYRGRKLPENKSGHNNLRRALHRALEVKWTQGDWWAKIEIRRELQQQHGDRLQNDAVEDATEWENCVQGFQTTLHDQELNQEPLGVSYRDQKGREVVVKTTTYRDPDGIQSEGHRLEILLFWWGEDPDKTSHVLIENQDGRNLIRQISCRSNYRTVLMP